MRIIIGLLALSLILLGLGVGITDSTSIEMQNNEPAARVLSQGYTDHENIFTQSDIELLDLATAEGWQGDGSEENPIIISGYRFYAVPIQPVRIWNTDLHWVFKNNLVETDGTMCGFYLTRTTAGHVLNNTFHSCHSGLAMINCQNILIENNTFIDNSGNGIDQEANLDNAIIRYNSFQNQGADGISLEDTYNVEIYENYINGITYDGVDTQNGHDISIENNTILNTRVGIKMGRRTTNIHVEGNLVKGTRYDGISCNADSVLITHNVLRNIGRDGIRFSGSMELFAEDNDVIGNCFINCSDYAIRIAEGVVGTTIMTNDFFESGRDCHICDNSTGAIIDENFYDTWIGPDTNQDSIVDIQYDIVGTSDNSDTTPKAGPNNAIPVDYEYVPLSVDTAGFPMNEIVIIGGVGILVCIIIVAMVKKR